MRQFLHLTFCFCLLVAFSIAASAQEKIEISTAPPPPMISLPILKKVGRAKITFNERKNEAIARTSLLPVSGSLPNGGIAISARFTSQGKKITKPEKIILGILASAKDRTYVDNRTIKIFFDDEQILNSTGKFVSADTNGEIIYAFLEQEIPYNIFVRMSKTKQIKMQIGATEFELKENDIEVFNDLLKTIED